MTVAYYSKTANVSREDVEKVYQFLGERTGDSGSDGHLYHADGPLDDGSWWTFDVFASDDDFTRYYEDLSHPAIRHAGIDGIQYHRLEVSFDSSQS